MFSVVSSLTMLVLSFIMVSLIRLVHSEIILPINLFLQIQSQKSLQSHLQVALFQICLLLHTDEFNRHTHLQLSCHNTLRVSLSLIKKL